jgi:hypothetical protein
VKKINRKDNIRRKWEMKLKKWILERVCRKGTGEAFEDVGGGRNEDEGE